MKLSPGQPLPGAGWRMATAGAAAKIPLNLCVWISAEGLNLAAARQHRTEPAENDRLLAFAHLSGQKIRGGHARISRRFKVRTYLATISFPTIETCKVNTGQIVTRALPGPPSPLAAPLPCSLPEHRTPWGNSGHLRSGPPSIFMEFQLLPIRRPRYTGFHLAPVPPGNAHQAPQ